MSWSLILNLSETRLLCSVKSHGTPFSLRLRDRASSAWFLQDPNFIHIFGKLPALRQVDFVCQRKAILLPFNFCLKSYLSRFHVLDTFIPKHLFPTLPQSIQPHSYNPIRHVHIHKTSHNGQIP
jgi:hypothetical protein